MKPVRFVLPIILLLYAFLYIATTRVVRCDDACQRYYGVDTMLSKNRPYVVNSFKCSDSVFCIFVNDSVPHNWPGLADTACTYLHAVSLPSTWILVKGYMQPLTDTLAYQRCP